MIKARELNGRRRRRRKKTKFEASFFSVDFGQIFIFGFVVFSLNHVLIKDIFKEKFFVNYLKYGTLTPVRSLSDCELLW